MSPNITAPTSRVLISGSLWSKYAESIHTIHLLCTAQILFRRFVLRSGMTSLISPVISALTGDYLCR